MHAHAFEALTAADAIAARTVRCTSCNAPIFFARTPGNRTIPMDIAPQPQGRYYIAYWTRSHIGLGNIATDQATVDADEPRFDTHFVSCPHASTHRRRDK